MPNELGLLTKAEAKNLRDIRLLAQFSQIKSMADEIAAYQSSSQLSKITYNRVVHENIVTYFKNTVGYTVTDNKQGQPAGFTLLIEIDWS